MVKFGGGFYCARIESMKFFGVKSIFVFNGFFMGMRGEFGRCSSLP